MILITVLALVVGCSGDSKADPETPRSGPGLPGSVLDLAEESTPRGVLVRALEEDYMLEDLDTALSLSYMVRRFGEIEDMEWAEHLVSRVIGWASSSTDDDALAMRPFLRLMTADISPVDAGQLDVPSADRREDTPDEVDTDVLVAQALWCDRLDSTGWLLEWLPLASAVGDYEATHALAAAQLMIENGCGHRDQVGALRDELASRVAELFDDDAMGDVHYEACALLYWADHRDLVPEWFGERVSGSQLPDGGWSLEDGGSSDQHATVWALRCSLEIEYAGKIPRPSWVVR